MVARAGIGFVMANADPELLALGMPVLPSNDEDGVATAIEEYVLRAVRETALDSPPWGAGRRVDKKTGGEIALDPPNCPGALTSSSSRPSSWQPSSSRASR